MVSERCLEGCAPSGQGTAVVCGVREITVYPFSDQFQDSFIAPCVFISTGWGIRKLALNEVASDTEPPQGNSCWVQFHTMR